MSELSSPDVISYYPLFIERHTRGILRILYHLQNLLQGFGVLIYLQPETKALYLALKSSLHRQVKYHLQSLFDSLFRLFL